MRMTQFAKFANDATNQILGTSGLIRENLQSMFSYPNAVNVEPITVSGNIIYIEDAAPINANSVKVYVELVQSGSGEPSPQNVRPINGWLKANITVAGGRPNQNATFNIIFPNEAGTVYGGMLDVTNGMLTVNKRFKHLDSSLTWSVESRDNEGVYWRARTLLTPVISGASYDIISDKLSPAVNTYYPAVYTVSRNAGGYILIGIPDTIQSVDAWKEYLDDIGGIDIVEPLSTPETYQLTPTNILMFKGINTIHADCGSMVLKYYRLEKGENPYE